MADAPALRHGGCAEYWFLPQGVAGGAVALSVALGGLPADSPGITIPRTRRRGHLPLRLGRYTESWFSPGGIQPSCRALRSTQWLGPTTAVLESPFHGLATLPDGSYYVFLFTGASPADSCLCAWADAPQGGGARRP